MPSPDSAPTVADQEFLTVREAAEWLRLAERTVYDLIRTDELPHIRLGNSIRIRKTDVLRLSKGGRS